MRSLDLVVRHFGASELCKPQLMMVRNIALALQPFIKGRNPKLWNLKAQTVWALAGVEGKGSIMAPGHSSQVP